jgi:hypothetical protein
MSTTALSNLVLDVRNLLRERFRKEMITNQVTLRVAQGQEISLLGRPYTAEGDILLMETVQPDASRSALEKAWSKPKIEEWTSCHLIDLAIKPGL